MKRETLTGYVFALFTIIVWGSTFISSKILLTPYTPAQIMLTRFLLAYAALWLLRPRRMALSWRQELSFIVLGLTGCSVYFYTENSALTYTLASNVSIIVAAAPIFTAILAHLLGQERFHRGTLLGFLVAFSGVILVVCNGTFVLKLNPRGAGTGCRRMLGCVLRPFAARQPGTGPGIGNPANHILGHSHRASHCDSGGSALSPLPVVYSRRSGESAVPGPDRKCPVLRPLE